MLTFVLSHYSFMQLVGCCFVLLYQRNKILRIIFEKQNLLPICSRLSVFLRALSGPRPALESSKPKCVFFARRTRSWPPRCASVVKKTRSSLRATKSRRRSASGSNASATRIGSKWKGTSVWQKRPSPRRTVLKTNSKYAHHTTYF